ncbi:ribosomal L27e family protein [Colletotrichum salicis]|uniref:60S ribosomal protein L27 n=1 Tax=Colletotrichum salicis TaxID=1209931 RepID=A0A135V3P6_9PEZI|nr:ribosomal L27e family protein [Colletotrichum salicis]
MKFLKVGRVAIITHGRYAGKKVRLRAKILEEAYPVAVLFSPDFARRRGVDEDNPTSTPRSVKVFGQGIMGGNYGDDYTKRLRIAKKEEGAPADQTLFYFSSVVIIQPVDSGNKAHPFGHALVAGIERYPSKITRRMSKTRQDKRNKIKPFVKLVNYNHLMPTRYTLELEGLKGVVSNDTFKEVTQREDAKKQVKKVLEERYTSGKNRWFFTPLRF